MVLNAYPKVEKLNVGLEMERCDFRGREPRPEAVLSVMEAFIEEYWKVHVPSFRNRNW